MGLMVSSTLGKPLYSCHFQMQLLPHLFGHQQKTLLPVHADLYALNTFSITGLSFFLSFFLFLMLFLLFCLFLFFSLERWRSQSQVIIKIKAQQNPANCITNKILEQQLLRLAHTRSSHNHNDTCRPTLTV